MRRYSEPTSRNLLRKPLVLGVPLIGIIILSFGVLGISLLGGSSQTSNLISIGLGTLGYVGLRMINRFAKNGWEESFVFLIETKLLRKKNDVFIPLSLQRSQVSAASPDTLDADEIVYLKDQTLEQLKEIVPEKSKIFLSFKGKDGSEFLETENVTGFSEVPPKLTRLPFAYSLYQLPTSLDPLWITGFLNRIKGDFAVLVRVDGLDYWSTKSRVETSRRRNARDDSKISNIDSEVSFEEASRVLEGLSRGDETLFEVSVVVLCKAKQELDPQFFCEEKDPQLSIVSALGIRKRTHRSLLVRGVTASDLIPNLLDPKEEGRPILTTRRGSPLYFSPLDTRLEALHWLVVGASGSGKSFLTGLIMKRLVDAGEKISVLFIDHNRSFKRLIESQGLPYLEPGDLTALKEKSLGVIETMDQPGAMAGMELSDLSSLEKKDAAHYLLSQIESFLRSRSTFHPVYIVLDECWNFMRDEPMLVQRAFREFRKLNGAAVAITQSLSDFLTDQAGQSIYQNAPVRILLRQGEDVTRYQSVLGLNSREISLLKSLSQRKGQYSECLIKTPFLSKLGRLYPTEAEHALLRTDNIREEMVQVAKAKATTEARSCL